MAFTSVKVTPAGSINSITEGFQFGSAFVNGIGLQRGYNTILASGANTFIVVLPIAEPDTNWSVQVEPNYSTTSYVSTKSASAFLVNFGTGATSSSTFDWILTR